MMLPAEFVTRMRQRLGDETDAFLAALARPPLVGLRVNSLKLAPSQLSQLVDWTLTPVPWCPTGFCVTDEDRPGRHPYHAAGLYYLQEPSAMAVVEALAPKPGDLVLDLAAAPGGKTTHLAALTGDSGWLLANEVEPSRVKPLMENVERWGMRQATITNAAPRRLAEQLGAVFDCVLVDAPCSGEGMFRKSEAALRQWSEKLVQGCALRQRPLLDTAAALIKPGGRLAYSTCTFAPEEDEVIIAAFLDAHPDFTLLPIPLPGLSPGRPEWVAAEISRPELSHTARLWPHLAPGEGHFIAVLQRDAGPAPRLHLAAVKEAPRPIARLWRWFAAGTLGFDPVAADGLTLVGDQVYAVPERALDLGGLRVVRPGLWLGTARGERFEPSHSLALALRPSDLIDSPLPRLDLAPDDERLALYLQGHPLPEPGPSGWTLITVAGFPLGWARRAQGILKNSYPKGLRRSLR